MKQLIQKFNNGLNMTTTLSLPSCKNPLPPCIGSSPDPTTPLATRDVIQMQAAVQSQTELSFDLSPFKLRDHSFVCIHPDPSQINTSPIPTPPETININFNPAELLDQVRQANRSSASSSMGHSSPTSTLESSTPVTTENPLKVATPNQSKPTAASPSLEGRVKKVDQGKCSKVWIIVLVVISILLIVGIIAFQIWMGPPKLQALPPFNFTRPL